MNTTPLAGPWRFLLAAVTALVAVGVVGVAPADAHAALLSTSPAASDTVGSEPGEVVLTFNEAISGLGAVVRVTGPSGQVMTGSVRVIDHTVHQTLRPDAGGGAYRVDWHVTSADGHPVSDTFTFTVTGAAATSRPAPSPSQAPTSIDPTVGRAGLSWPLWAASAAVILLLLGIGVRARSRGSEAGSGPATLGDHGPGTPDPG